MIVRIYRIRYGEKPALRAFLTLKGKVWEYAVPADC